MTDETARVTLFCHVHYVDIWQEMADLLAERLVEPFDLVVTTSLDQPRLSRPATRWLRQMTVLETENRGRDIRPFIEALRRTPGFEIGLKLHTKRSEHRIDGGGWRNAMIESLLPSPEAASRIVNRLDADDRLSILAVDGMLCSIKPWMHRNAPAMARVAEKIGVDLDPLIATSPRFAAGSMFWFRRSALLPFAEADLDSLFEPERGQSDGTAAHACERLFMPVAELGGGMGTTVGVLLATDIETPDAALRLATSEATDVPNAYLQPLSQLGGLVYRYAPFLIAAYLRLPLGARRLVKAIFARS